MEIYENILGNLTPSELDELAGARFDAKAPRGAVKRIKKAAVEKAGLGSSMSATERKRRRIKKPLIIAAAAVVASAATLFTVNASTGGNLVRFFIGGKEVEAEHRDYVDHDGYRHVSFDAMIPIEAENYAVIFDADAPDFEDAVRVLTDDSDPEFFESLRQYHAEFERIGQERNALMDAGGDENDLPEYREAEEFGLISKDSEVCCWNLEFLEDGRKQGGCGAFGGKLKTTGTTEGRPPKYSKSENIDYDNGTKSVHLEVKYYVGLD